MTAVIVDVSCAASFVLPDESDPIADSVFGALPETRLIVPDLFWHELGNTLLVQARRSRLSADDARLSYDFLQRLPIETRVGPRGLGVMAFAETHGLSAYDAAYGYLAQSENCSLATLDKRLIAAGEAGAFSLWNPTS